MKKIVLLLMLVPMAYCTMAQGNFPFVAKNIDEFKDPKMDPTLKNVRVDNADMVLVKTTSGSSEYTENDVWGFRDKHGNEYRIYDGDKYRVLELGNLCIYSRLVDETNMDEGRTPSTELNPTTEIKYYFSRRLGGDIYELNDANLDRVFSPTNEKFVTLLKSCKREDNLIKYDKKRHDYKVEELYKESKNRF